MCPAIIQRHATRNQPNIALPKARMEEKNSVEFDSVVVLDEIMNEISQRFLTQIDIEC